MENKVLRVIVQFVKESSCKVFVRPYLNKSPVQNETQVAVVIEPLPEENHWRVEVSAKVRAINAEGALCAEGTGTVEAITVAVGLTAEELDESLRFGIAGAVFGSVRAVLSQASTNSGYGPWVLPPMSVNSLAELSVPLTVNGETESSLEN